MKDTKQRLREQLAERRLARVWLALTAALLAIFVVVGPSFGQGFVGVLQQTGSPSPTGTPAPSGPSIALLNPSTNPGTFNCCESEDTPPKISDKDDGVDTAYHLLASVSGLPTNAIVEAYVAPTTALGVELPEQTIGLMSPLGGDPNTYELYWDVPDSLPEGSAVIRVRLYTQTAAGIEEIAMDEVPVELRHKERVATSAGDAQPAAETVELTWPSQDGQLGFHQPKGGRWRTRVDATTSVVVDEDFAALFVVFFYTKSAPGTPPEWVRCGSAAGFLGVFFGGRVSTTCTLAGKDKPSDLTYFSAYVFHEESQTASGSLLYSEESSDTHRVRGYDVNPHDMKIEIIPFIPNSSSDVKERQRALVGSPTATSNPGRCLAFKAIVRDDLDRIVMGANIDWHIQGPNDQVTFGAETRAGALLVTEAFTSGNQPPDKEHTSKEPAHNCDRLEENPGEGPNERPTRGEQGDHNIAGGNDVKHRESVLGTGLDSGTGMGVGEHGVLIYSPVPGFTEITAWIDDELIPDDSVDRAADTDTLDEGEPFATTRAQWLRQPIRITADPVGDTAEPGECNPYVFRVRSGTDAVPGINVDVHATGPDNELDFCTPPGGSARRAPTLPASGANQHQPEDDGEASHEGNPRAQHTEGETDESGNFVVGITSLVTGDSTLQAWVDGESTFDNDIIDSAETQTTATKSWARCTNDIRVSLMNPSAYGAGTSGSGTGDRVGNKLDLDGNYHVVARTDCPQNVASLEVLTAPGSSGGVFTKVGDAQRVGLTDTYEFMWPVTNVADGTHRLRAQIPGTTTGTERPITVNNADDPQNPDPADEPWETVEITSPANSSVAPFTNKAVTVRGTASANAEGVEFYYTKVASKDSPESASWTFCGWVDVRQQKNFSGSCALQGADQPALVTGIAAITFDCNTSGCNPNPQPPPPTAGAPAPPREPGSKESGDAHRVFGLEANPLVSIEPAEARAEPGSCQRLVLSVVDQTGQPVRAMNVDVHATGPNENIHFCNPDDGSTRRAPDEGGHTAVSDEPSSGLHEDDGTHHTEGETSSSGRFIFGVTSPNEGDTQLFGWVDHSDNDVRDVDENADTSVIHWASTTTGGGGSDCTITGTSGNDRLVGTDGDDVICGRGGDDTIIGKGGNDTLLGGRGRDVLRGGPGNDILKGGFGPDTLLGGAGADRLQGRQGADVLRGAAGDDLLRGGDGRDTLKGGAGDDRLIGGRGADDLDGGTGTDFCRGGPGRDRIRRCEEGSRTSGRAMAV